MVYFDNKNRCFHLRTRSTSYLIAVSETGHLLNLYYGKRLSEQDAGENLIPVSTLAHPNQTSYSLNHPDFVQETSRLEFSHPGKGDYRNPSCSLQAYNGGSSFDFVYHHHQLLSEKPPIDGLPSAEVAGLPETGTPEEPFTLEITLRDNVQSVDLTLSYSTVDACDVICRHSRLHNRSGEVLVINKIMSASLDIETPNWDCITLDGAWSRERHLSRRAISPGKHEINSRKGTSSSDHSPFIALCAPNTNRISGEALGAALVYSGNHSCSVELSPHGITRLQTGINPETFCWNLAPGTIFRSPEALLSYSHAGLNTLSQNFHQLVHNHVIPKRWRNTERPVLANNWEATYFDFNTKKILALAGEAASLGIELFVLDDGWFGKRSDDTSSLGDWFVNSRKLPGGLMKLADRIRDLGLEFGIWVEPEMISIDSDLYRAHPDWMVKTPGRTPSPARNQYLLDMVNPEVRNYLFDQLSKLFEDTGVSYVKWDMNRNFSDVFSPLLQPRQQGEFAHRYQLGLYELLTRITQRFPHILFEGCSAGGNRFDIGMLSFMPQIWTSDNSDAAERLSIQEGSSYFAPPSAMGAHVSAVPNHQTLRNTPIETRFNVAAFGVLGYELDLTKLTRFERKVIQQQIRFYKEYRSVLQFGWFYKLKHPEEPNSSAWMVVSEDRSKAVCGIFQKLSTANPPSLRIKLAGLEPEFSYDIEARQQYIDLHSLGDLASRTLPVKLNSSGKIFEAVANHHMMPVEHFRIRARGDELMSAGLRTPQRFHGGGYAEGIALTGDFSSRLYVLSRIQTSAG